MKRVNVLLSTYNGEKYIREQIDSILGQSYENVRLYVRDDGSTDSTAEILREYEAQGKLILETGKNVGFIKSFLWLVRNCGEADYYAYADQDDVWVTEKIAMAIERLEREEGDMPLLYFSNYDYCDEQLCFVAHAFPLDGEKHPTFQNAIADCMPLGFNSVFNHAARVKMTEHTPTRSCGHDWWTYLVCQGLGKIVYDNRVTVMYRRTGTNVSPGGMDFVKHQIWRIKKFVFGGYFKNVRAMLAEYWHLYRDELSEEDRRLLSLFVRKGYNPIAAFHKAFHRGCYRRNTADELMIRFFFLIGRM